MKRSPIKPESVKHRAYREELYRARNQVLSRCGGICEMCGYKRATVIHHKLRRAQGGGNEPENLAGLCSICHTFIHDHPDEGYLNGWLVRASNPATIRTTRGGA